MFAQDIDIVRSNYLKSAGKKELCLEMIEKLSDAKQGVFIAYLGAYQTLWANHTASPLSKWNTFKKGKRNIEKAISLDPNNPETRLLRLSVQLNAPKFLGYYTDIEADKKIVNQQREILFQNKNIKELFQQLLK